MGQIQESRKREKTTGRTIENSCASATDKYEVESNGNRGDSRTYRFKYILASGFVREKPSFGREKEILEDLGAGMSAGNEFRKKTGQKVRKNEQRRERERRGEGESGELRRTEKE